MASELIPFKDDPGDPRFAACYARGSVFKREGRFLRVERGMRTIVPRALCMAAHFGSRCQACPNYHQRIVFRPAE